MMNISHIMQPFVVDNTRIDVLIYYSPTIEKGCTGYILVVSLYVYSYVFLPFSLYSPYEYEGVSPERHSGPPRNLMFIFFPQDYLSIFYNPHFHHQSYAYSYTLTHLHLLWGHNLVGLESFAGFPFVCVSILVYSQPLLPC